jgi:hypothetical protein
VVTLDGDAWEIGRALAMRLQLKGKQANFIRLPPKKDPNDLGVEVLTELARGLFQ